MSLLLSFFMMIASLFTPITNCTVAYNDEMSVISSSAYLFVSPSFESEKVLQNEKEIILHHGDKVVATVDENESDFIKVKLKNNEEINGYIYKFFVTKNTPQTVYPVFNGSIRYDNVVIYDINKKETTFKAYKNQKIFLYNGFDDKEEFTPIQIVLDGGELYNGFVKTSDIKPKGISSLLIVGITIIAASATILLSLIFIKKAKKKKKKVEA